MIIDNNKLSNSTCKQSRNSKKRLIVLNNKQELLMSSLIKYFQDLEKINKIVPIINGKSNISLRLIDWFVTNYCKKFNIIYKKINIHLSYKTQLKSFSKKQFDPFRRDERIYFQYNTNNNQNEYTIGSNVAYFNNNSFVFNGRIVNINNADNTYNIEYDLYKNKSGVIKDVHVNNIKPVLLTTPGQLNFFKWILKYNILDYVNTNLSTIEKDMNSSVKMNKQRRLKNIKRKQLSICATKTINKHVTKITVEFD